MLIQTENLSQRYGDYLAVKGLNLEINKGSLVALLGPNGAGKSTTMRMLTGLAKPSAGKVTYAPNTKIGLVFQESVLDANLTVQENLAIRAKQYKHIEAARILLLIHDLGLTSFQDQKYGSLSGGQKRRVDIARALLNEPDVLFLDEPTTGLDIQTRNAIWALLHDLQENRGLTIVLTTHYLDEADHADEVFVIDHGQLIASGSAISIKATYAKNQLLIWPKEEQEEALKDALARQKIESSKLSDGAFQMAGLAIKEVLALLEQTTPLIENFEYRPGTMDDAFVALTGKEMR
ncbi:ABC transporter ATP-binding protein [Fructobacillus sp. M1-13]|uniref:ABC transporter ATP-binding protein n=1 Tax=Fructobacillus papyriferae TaxID=2713171 RepID=A0ABS5QQU4_9LACO|nr:ABC transporter ATP-binding protein [Fructobacillus papyriferae]MBS9335559.1 ABC transporter ATP-binding protein [Fructobacillus papyriferae]MCD2159351.1 ABC transporter ATP-binding protein [Fructobacillus papyriferae]